jgi:hypothetical protein
MTDFGGGRTIEVADRHRLQTVETVEQPAVVLSDLLMQRVRRLQIAGHALDLGQDRIIAVHGRGRREHDPSDPEVA